MKHLDNQKEQILTDHSFGGSIAFLSNKYGCSRNTMRDKLKEWDAYIPKKFKGEKR